MSDFDIINFLMINDVGHSTKNNEHLQDLRDRAAYLAKKTGEEPVSWFEFKQGSIKEEPKTLRNAAIGASIGAILGGVFLSIPLAISGAIIGGAIGGFTDTENTRRDKLVKEYENYLDGFEATVGRSRAVSQGFGGLDNLKTTHAAELVADRQQAPHQAITI